MLRKKLYFLKKYFTLNQTDLELFLREQRAERYQNITTTRIP